MVYSAKDNDGFLTKAGIEAIRSELAHDIFRQDFAQIYEEQNLARSSLKEKAAERMCLLADSMLQGVCENPIIGEKLQQLSGRLKNTGGKKVYGYLKADVKRLVDQIVDELAKDPAVSEAYRAWGEWQDQIRLTYRLGSLYLLGEDVPQDLEEAVRWLELSADQGNQYAQYALGKLFLCGQPGMPRDKEKAVPLLKASAVQGNVYAQFLLENLDSFQDPDLVLAATRLIHHLSRIFQENYRKASGGSGMGHISQIQTKKFICFSSNIFFNSSSPFLKSSSVSGEAIDTRT